VKLPTRFTFLLPWSIIINVVNVPPARSVVVVVRSTADVFVATAASSIPNTTTTTAATTTNIFVIHFCKTGDLSSISGDRNKMQSST